MGVLSVVAIIIAGLMVGCELAFAVLAHPMLGELPDDVGWDLYELSRLLGHSDMKMTERYADLAWAHTVKTGSVFREL